jgi:heterodisulfide reductase subunit A
MITNNKKKLVGAVLVEGGGIAGVQASLDLANSGYKVYLVNRSPHRGYDVPLDGHFRPALRHCVISPNWLNAPKSEYRDFPVGTGEAWKANRVILIY